MGHIRKVDLNQKEIVEGLRALGFTVRHTHTVGRGFPDIVIGKYGKNLLVEIKQDGEPLTLDEKEFFDMWQGAVIIGTGIEQIQEEFKYI